MTTKYINTFFWSILGVLLLLFVSACDGLTDLNENPNDPTNVPERLQLPALQSNFSYTIIGGEPSRYPSLLIQQLGYSGVAPTEFNYDIKASTVNNIWEFNAYPDVLKNARILASQAEENTNYAYAGIARVIQAWTLSIMTDLFGDIPWSEAFNPENTRPTYDTQEQVYNAVFELLDAAIADFGKESLTTPGADSDLIYQGDMERWRRLAHTLKARLLMHLSRAPGYTEEEQATQALAALQSGFQSNADDADFQYYETSGAENPWYQWTIDGKWNTNNQLSETYVELLKSRNDPRLPIQARPVGAVNANGIVDNFNPDSIFYAGQPIDEDGVGAVNVSSIGAFYSAPDAALNLISYASSEFVKAEATLITSGAGAAQPIYENAIRANMQKLGVPEAEIDAYVSSRPALTDPSVNPLEEIIVEKYIANFLNVEAYNDFRRTGYPALQPMTFEPKVDVIPVRFPYPDSELSRNAENVTATGVPIGYEALKVPVWWDTTP